MKRKVAGIIAMNTRLPSETTVYFKDLTSINYSKPTISSSNIGWIELVGVNQGGKIMQTIDTKGKLINNVDTVNNLKNPYCIVFNKNKSEMEEYYRDIKEIFEKNKNTNGNNFDSVTNIIQEESALDKIKKLKDLLDIGAISQEEFDKKKSKLMSDI